MKTTSAVCLLLCVACGGGKNIRRLENVEEAYYKSLEQRLAESKAPMAQLLGTTRTVEERAVREAVMRDARVQAATMVYAVREMLAAPRNDRAAFIQATRNKIVLLSLEKLAALEDESVRARLAVGDEQRNALDSLLDSLTGNLHRVIETEKSLHRYLNQDAPRTLRNLVNEVQRQLSAFSGDIAKADRSSATAQKLTEVASRAQQDVGTAKQDLDKFIGVWSQLNREEE